MEDGLAEGCFCPAGADSPEPAGEGNGHGGEEEGTEPAGRRGEESPKKTFPAPKEEKPGTETGRNNRGYFTW